jgi:hypothetical protein
MKGRACCLMCLTLVLLVSLTACAAQVTWAKYVSQDGSFSFHYPKGWQVKEDESVIVLEGEDSGEEVYFFALPYEHTWSAEEHARFMLSALHAENPGLEACGWESDSESETVLFNLVYGGGAHSYELGSYAEGMRNYRGEVADATGIDKKEVDKVLAKLKKEGKIVSPKRCFQKIQK